MSLLADALACWRPWDSALRGLARRAPEAACSPSRVAEASRARPADREGTRAAVAVQPARLAISRAAPGAADGGAASPRKPDGLGAGLDGDESSASTQSATTQASSSGPSAASPTAPSPLGTGLDGSLSLTGLDDSWAPTSTEPSCLEPSEASPGELGRLGAGLGDGDASPQSSEASASSGPSRPGCGRQCLAGCGGARPVQGPASGGRPTAAARGRGEATLRGGVLGDFRVVRTVGSGFLGSVRLVVRAGGGEPAPFALKVMKKREVLRRRQVVHTRQEKELLGKADHPFIVKLFGTFQDEANLYMLMEFANGGELFSVVRSAKRLHNGAGKFYAAEIILAIGHLHGMSVAYRDLKLENVLLDSCGHVKLVDFGFAKVVHTRTYTMCGTPDYLAPEIINRKGHDKCVDWWALGVLVYEMLVGHAPFRGATATAIYQKAISVQPEFPSGLTENARSLIAGLLTKLKRRRLGAGRGDAEEVKGHQWFESVRWARVLQKRYSRAPFLPPVTNSSDTSMFGGCREQSVCDKPVGLTTSEQRQFVGW